MDESRGKSREFTTSFRLFQFLYELTIQATLSAHYDKQLGGLFTGIGYVFQAFCRNRDCVHKLVQNLFRMTFAREEQPKHLLDLQRPRPNYFLVSSDAG